MNTLWFSERRDIVLSKARHAMGELQVFYKKERAIFDVARNTMLVTASLSSLQLLMNTSNSYCVPGNIGAGCQCLSLLQVGAIAITTYFGYHLLKSLKHLNAEVISNDSVTKQEVLSESLKHKKQIPC